MKELNIITLGILLGILGTACLAFPGVARALGKIVSVVGIGIGVGLLTFGILSTIDGDFKPFISGPIYVASASQAMGIGSGLLAGGIVALVLAYIRADSERSAR